MSSGSTDGAHSRNTVDGGGSSTTFSSALAAPSVSRSASSITTICQRPVLGRRDAVGDDGAHLVDADGQALRDDAPHVGVGAGHRRSCRPGTARSPGVPSAVHCSAAAKHSAATDRPDPGGPVISQACVIECRWRRIVSGITPGGAMRRATNSASTALWPTSRVKTPDIACQH